MGFLFSLFPMGCWFLIFVFLFDSVFRFMQFWLALENWMTALEKPLPIGESISRRVPRQRVVPGGNGKRYSRKRVKWGAQAPLLLASQRLVTGNLLNLANNSSTATASADTTNELL